MATVDRLVDRTTVLRFSGNSLRDPLIISGAPLGAQHKRTALCIKVGSSSPSQPSTSAKVVGVSSTTSCRRAETTAKFASNSSCGFPIASEPVGLAADPIDNPAEEGVGIGEVFGAATGQRSGAAVSTAGGTAAGGRAPMCAGTAHIRQDPRRAQTSVSERARRLRDPFWVKQSKCPRTPPPVGEIAALIERMALARG